MNILAFFAHPDDESMLCGGTLALFSRQGARVSYLCATHGEGGELGEPPLCTREQVAEVRSAELACAVHALGGARLDFLNYIDPLVSPQDELYAFEADFETLVNQIVSVLLEGEINYLVTHGSNGEYGHPAHLLVHQAAIQAVQRLPLPGIGLYTVQACFAGHPKPRLANRDDPADFIIDVEPLREQKTRAALCHRTQHALFIRRTSQNLGRQVSVPEVVSGVESLHRVRAGAPHASRDTLTTLLQDSGLLIE